MKEPTSAISSPTNTCHCKIFLTTIVKVKQKFIDPSALANEDVIKNFKHGKLVRSHGNTNEKQVTLN